MSKMKSLLLGLLAALLMTLAACDTATAPENDPALTTQAPGQGERGGFFQCKEFLPASTTKTDKKGVTYTSDNRGRPLQAVVVLPNSSSRRYTNCQGKIGNLFEDESNPNYEGGHLIATRFGGYGKRANIVPQSTSLNNKTGGKGYWTKMEDIAATCEPVDNVEMRVTVQYEQGEGIVPTKMFAAFEDRITGDDTIVTFENDNNSDSANKKALNKARRFLQEVAGCGSPRS